MKPVGMSKPSEIKALIINKFFPAYRRKPNRQKLKVKKLYSYLYMDNFYYLTLPDEHQKTR